MIMIMRGLPGSGKSTYIRENFPGAEVCSADHFFMEDGEYRFDPAKIGEAHGGCLRKYMKVLEAHSESASAQTIVVDNTNTQAWEISPYIAIANAFGMEAEIVNFTVSVETAVERNIHGVPEHVIRAMNERLEKESIPPFWKQSFITA